MDSMKYVITVVVQDDIDFETFEEAEECLRKLADLGFYDASIVLQSVDLHNEADLKSLSYGNICHKGEKNVEK